MKILLDMNLPTSWVGFLRQEDFESVHWSEVGDPRASDLAIMTWAYDNGFVIFTHDLDKVTSRVRILPIGQARR
jgi:predicted nuclease of predicted toxin-antitoxin system